jgi:hypothetical protein
MAVFFSPGYSLAFVFGDATSGDGYVVEFVGQIFLRGVSLFKFSSVRRAG